MSDFALRDYQHDLLRRTLEAVNDGDTPVMVSLATGAGKTALIPALQQALGKRVLSIAPSRSVAMQQPAECQAWGVDTAFGAAEAWPEAVKSDADIICSTWQTAVKRVETTRGFGLLVVDEAHHAVAGTLQTERLIDKFRRGRKPVVGLTATPWRLSRKEGFTPPWRALVEGPQWHTLLRDGYLAGVAEMDSSIRIEGGATNALGEFTEGGIAAGNADFAVKTASAVADLVGEHLHDGRTAIVYAVGQQHAVNVANLLAEHGQPTGLLVSSGAYRNEADARVETDPIMAAELYRARELKVLVNVAMVTEGYDAPSSDIVMVLRPTMSLALWLQMCGRGSRRTADKSHADAD